MDFGHNNYPAGVTDAVIDRVQGADLPAHVDDLAGHLATACEKLREAYSALTKADSIAPIEHDLSDADVSLWELMTDLESRYERVCES